MDEQENLTKNPLAGREISIGATVLNAGKVDPADLKQAETATAEEWKPGDVILDLYEVRKVTEGFGEDAEEMDYYQGGFGRVYKVWHRGWNMELAVKVPRREAYDTAAKKENFIRECETWIDLGLHPHVAACHYVRELGGVLRVFSEYASGGTLADWIRYRRLYEGDQKEVLARMLDIAIQFAWGLDYAHEQGLVHQDVKPLNLLMMEDGTAKVTDFGLARARKIPEGELQPRIGGEHGGTLLVSGGHGYTLAYCSPEQLAGEKLTRRTDIWSWAVSLLQMFTGEVCWQSGMLAGAALQEFLNHDHEEEGIPRMPEEVATLLQRCFQRDPENRPRTMVECVEALTEVYEIEMDKPYDRPVPKPAEMTADGLNNRALSMLDLGRPEEAERLFDEALQLHADHVQVTYNRGLMLWHAGRMGDDKILEMLRGCEQTARNGPHVPLCLGLIAWEQEDYEAAEKHFERAVLNGGGIEARTAHAQAQAHVSESARCLLTFKGHTAGIQSVCLSTDGRLAISGSQDNKLKLWDMSTGTCRCNFEGHLSSVTSVYLSADGRWALSGSGDQTIKLWDMAGNCLRTFEGHSKPVSSVYLSADGRWALSGDGETLKLWNVAAEICHRTFEGHTGDILTVCLTVDGRLAVSGGRDEKLNVWEVSTGKCLHTCKGHKSYVSSVCVSADGRWALSGSWDETLKLWDMATGNCLRTLEGHSGPVDSVFLSADGCWALSGSWDKTVKLWDVAAGACRRTFEGHTDWVESVCLSKDGLWALSGSSDKTLKKWSLGTLCLSSRKHDRLVYCQVMTVREVLLHVRQSMPRYVRPPRKSNQETMLRR